MKDVLAPRLTGMVLALVLLHGAVARAQCPGNPIFLPAWTDPQAFSNEVRSTCPAHPPLFPGYPDDCADRGAYDLHLGTTSLQSSNTQSVPPPEGFPGCVPGNYITMPVVDLFTITGPASPVPLAVDVRLRITGSRGASTPVGQVSLATPADSIVFTAPFTLFGSTFDSAIVLHLSRLPGQAFPLTVRTAAQSVCGGGGGVQLQTTLTFALPAGYGITSCHGYQAAVVTSAVRRTWGSVKSSYR